MVQAAEQAYSAALTASETYGRSRVAVAAATAQDNAEALTEQHARALEVLDKKEAKATAAHTAWTAALAARASMRAHVRPDGAAAPAQPPAVGAALGEAEPASSSLKRMGGVKRKQMVSEHMSPGSYVSVDLAERLDPGKALDKTLASNIVRHEELAAPLAATLSTLKSIAPEERAALVISNPGLAQRLEKAEEFAQLGVNHAMIQSLDYVLVHRSGGWGVITRLHGSDLGEGISATERKRIEKAVKEEAEARKSPSKATSKPSRPPKFRGSRDYDRDGGQYRGGFGGDHRDGPRGGAGRGFGGAGRGGYGGGRR